MHSRSEEKAMPDYETGTELSSAEVELMAPKDEPEPEPPPKPKKTKPKLKSKDSWKDQLEAALPGTIGEYEIESWNRRSGTTYAIRKGGGSVSIYTLRDILQKE